MKATRFLIYYCKLLLSISLGVYQTCRPLDLKSQWRFWKNRDHARSARVS